jgi:hypothetical protein
MSTKPRRASATSIATNPGHPGWPVLEAQGLTLDKIKVLAELLANSAVDSEDSNVLADVIIDLLATAEAQRNAALDTLRSDAAG